MLFVVTILCFIQSVHVKNELIFMYTLHGNCMNSNDLIGMVLPLQIVFFEESFDAISVKIPMLGLLIFG